MKSRFHYAWVICAGCFMAHFFFCGMLTLGLSIHMPYLRDELGLTNAQVSMISTLRCLSTVVTFRFSKRFYQRFSLRKGLFITSLLLAGAYLGFSHASSAAMLYMLAGLLGVAYALGGAIPITILLRQWFDSGQTTAVSIALCGSGACAAIIPSVLTVLIGQIGLRKTFAVECVFTALFAVMLFAIVRDTPDALGLTAYRNDDSGRKAVQPKTPQGNMQPHETYLLLTAIFLLGGVNASSTSHLAIHYATAGYSAGMASLAFAIFGIVLIPGKFFYGLMADRLGSYPVNYIFLTAGVFAGCTTALLQNGASGGMLFLSAFLQGVGVPVGTVGVSVWILDLSSERTFLRNLQFSQIAYAIGGLVTNPVPGLIADHTGSFSLAFMLCGLMTLIATIIIQTIYRRHLGTTWSGKKL